ncbi:hypothetical protein CC79DRAFT_88828 [Sarocladium strictum]
MHSFFPKADAAPLPASPEAYSPGPTTIGPVYDRDDFATPLKPWTLDTETTSYPSDSDPCAASSIPVQPSCPASRYLRPTLAKNERLRLSMVWYYGDSLRNESNLLSGLCEKAYHARDSTGWEFAVIGIQDINVYIRLATAGLPLGILPRGETLCAHTATQAPGNVFMLPNMLEDWRFRDCPYVEQGGLVAYAGIPLRIQHEPGESVSLGTLCVASSTPQPPLTKSQQRSLTRLADWVVADIVQSTRTRRQQERHRLSDLIGSLKNAGEDMQESVLRILRIAYPSEQISIQSCLGNEHYNNGRYSGPYNELQNGLWEDSAYIDEFIASSNHMEPPQDTVVRFVSAPCESKPGHCILAVATKNFRKIFDDIDAWFVQTCASMLTQTWQKRLLSEAIQVKETFIRGVSHQLRTPIHGILGAAELLAEDLQSGNIEKSSLYLDAISIAGRDLMSTVNSMIIMNRWTEIALAERQYSVYDVADVETELTKGLSNATLGFKTSKVPVFFHNQLPQNTSNIRTDLSLLSSSVLPLLVNAVQNTSAGALVVTFSVRPGTAELWIDIEDTGCGIHPDDQGRIFQLYEKVGEHSTGAGLGLALATKYSSLLQGSISLVSSQVNQGSHFRATFRDAACAASALPPSSIIASLESLPLNFHRLGADSTETPLLSNFAKFLTHGGLTQTEDPSDCFHILEYTGKSKETNSQLASIPTDQVAICLAAEPADLKSVKPLPNVVYVSGPFSTCKLLGALQEVNQSLMMTAQSPLSDDTEPILSLTKSLADAEISISTSSTNGSRTSVDDGNASSARTSSPTGDLVRGSSSSSDSGSDGVESVFESRESASGTPDSCVIPARPPKPMVLVVDDNAVNLRLLEMYCKNRGLAYLSAGNGKQAFDIFSQHQESCGAGEAFIGLVLMDLQMPVCGGLDATQHIRALEKQRGWPRSVLFIVTGQDSQDDREAASVVGADDYLVKPVGMKHLDSKLREFFDGF